MQILKEKPPIWEEAHKHFQIDDSRTTYTYGDKIYNPAGIDLPLELVAHESVHCRQQGDDPAAWWVKYFADKAFRLSQEVEAYAEQYRFYCERHANRRKQYMYLEEIGKILSSPMYDAGISKIRAMQLIKG